MLFQDLTGTKLHMLTFLRFVGKNKTGQSRWLTLCDCGIEKVVAAHHVKSGNAQSCGCIAKGVNRSNLSKTHGGTGTPEYESYNAAKKRCNPKRANEFPDHAGRGIEFRFSGFKQFLAEIGPRPEPKFDYSLERINNDGHYELGNVKWATRTEQARNRRCDRCEALKARIRELEALITAA